MMRCWRSDGKTDNRFNDHEELRYSLRSVARYAPFVNHIYIITMNQRPIWLADHPKITIVDHAEIFRNLDDLPTFNSHALESNIHRVPGLSEHFIYFNDDVFLGAPVQPEYFFVGDQLNVLFEKGLTPSGPPQENETVYRRALRNMNAFLDEHFIGEPRQRLCHAPFALRKSYIEDFERKFPHIFAINSSHRFRSEHDYTLTNGLLQYYWKYQGKIVFHPLGNMMVSLRRDEFFERTAQRLQRLKEKRPATFCLQDVMDNESILTKALLHQFLEGYYPEPAPWEKDHQV